VAEACTTHHSVVFTVEIKAPMQTEEFKKYELSHKQPVLLLTVLAQSP
jgi:hypothetical protein